MINIKHATIQFKEGLYLIYFNLRILYVRNKNLTRINVNYNLVILL